MAARWYNILGPIFLFGLTIGIGVFYLVYSPAARTHIPDFVALLTIMATTLYSFVFLIAPEFDNNRGLYQPGATFLAGLLVLAFTFATLLLSIYMDRTFLGVSAASQYYSVKMLAALIAPFVGTVHPGTNYLGVLINFHFIIFVLVFSAIDLSFWTWSPRDSDKKRFKRLCLAIDLPMIIGVLVVVLLKSQMPDPDVFESGAISLAFILGSAMAYILDRLNPPEVAETVAASG